MRALHQFVAGFTAADAISNEALVLRDIFRSWGYASEIFSEARRILPELRRHARDFGEYVPRSRPDDVLLLHLSIGSAVNPLVARRLIDTARKHTIPYQLAAAAAYTGTDADVIAPSRAGVATGMIAACPSGAATTLKAPFRTTICPQSWL